MSLRVVAIAAPELPAGGLGGGVLSREDPTSLYNACRYAALLAENGVGPWAESNWAQPRTFRRQSLLLMHSLQEDMPAFERLLEDLKPNLLLMGAMSLCLPGAVVCAQRAKEMFGDDICVVLGGRHPSESIFVDRTGAVAHHVASPLRLMVEGRIPAVFDLVVAGEGEHLLAWIGAVVGGIAKRGLPPARASAYLGEITRVPGSWILGWLEGEKMYTFVQRGMPLDHNLLPPPCAMFGTRSAFDVFGGRLTAQVYSDTGNGCAFDCEFCSERRSVTGPPIQLDSSADRLFWQLKSAVDVVAEDAPEKQASAFVEDSTLLAGSSSALRRLTALLQSVALDLRFGGQFTIDQILGRWEILRDLRSVGLDYLFIGIETPDPSYVKGMSKNIRTQDGTWLIRAERVFEGLQTLRIHCGAAILFGLGESHASRIAFLHQLQVWQRQFGLPDPVSINWAVQHPLNGRDGGMDYRYNEWGTPPGPWLEVFRDFGEASLRYPLAGQPQPIFKEVEEVAQLYQELREHRVR